MKGYRFSLILCTLGRTDDVERFLVSLENQTYNNVELIIVDQNKDERITRMVHAHSTTLDIKIVKSDRGLSKSRNKGLKYVSGDIVGFPDDDCLYPTDLLHKVNNYFLDNNVEVLSIKMTNSVSSGRKMQENTKSQSVHKFNVIGLLSSISAFYKKSVIESVGEFDERLGLGSHTIFQGGEDYDYPLRALKNGFIVYYTNTIEVLHPWDNEQIDKQKDLTSRSYNGGAAEMFLLNKHEFPLFYKFFRIGRRIMITVYYLIKRNLYKSKLSWAILKGMLAHFRYIP